MKLSVKGKQIDVGDALRLHVETQLRETIGKYFSDRLDAVDAHVTLSRDAHLFCCDIVVNTGRGGIVLQSKDAANEPYPAFDAALTRLAGRLRRYKNKIKHHHHEAAREQIAAQVASAFVLHGDDHGREEEVNDNPAIVAEMTAIVETLTVSEAVMRLDLGDLPALMFRNRGHGGLNMIYRRADGNIGWVDPAESVAPAAKTAKAI